MNSPRYARLVAEVLKREDPRASELWPISSNRDEEIALIEMAMDKRRRRSARLRRAAGWSVAAALVLAGAGAWRSIRQKTPSPPIVASSAGSMGARAAAEPVAIAIASGSGAIVAAPGSSAPAVAGHALRAGSRLIVDPSAGATLSLSTGTHLEVEPGSQLSVIENSRAQIFALNAGSLRADVAKLASNERFIVRTADAEVEVRGTSFLVNVVASDPACGAGTTTRVTVFEGVVTVRSAGKEEHIAHGEHWPQSCRRSPALTNSARGSSKHPPKADAPLGAPPTPASAKPPSSTLAEENDLFAEGMLARRHGNVRLAVEKMDLFLARYPASHLTESATAERMRLLGVLDPTSAAAAARHYLQRYPSGFARTDAETILAGMR
jgi:hypothetical protein